GAGLDVLHFAVLESEQREVTPHADVAAGVDDRADLTHENVAGEDDLPAVALDPPALRLRVATVAGAPLTFFVCNGLGRLRSAGASADRGDLERGERLPVARL